MNKKKNDKLVLASYSKNALNRKAVNKITTLLSKSDLKSRFWGLLSGGSSCSIQEFII